MKKTTKLSGASLLALSVASALIIAAPQFAVAQAAPAAADEPAAEEVIIVTGTRRVSRSAADTPAPVDIIGGAEIAKQGESDTSNLIRNLVPSFNVNTQAINDASSIVRPVNLRGLAPDQTLVLVNGKRRHRAAVINFLGGGVSDGAQGPDISSIPSIALKQVEVLRDGAAAQYGSDAIAGVMNFILRTDSDGAEVEAKYGQFYEGDGTSYQVAGNFGLGLGENGFANISLEYRQAGATSRSVQRSDAAALAAAGNTAIPNPAQIWGQPELKSDYKAFVNAGFDLGNGRSIYAFGNYGTRETDGGFYYRNPNTRGGVFSNDGGTTRLIADTTPGSGTTCPVIRIGAANEAALIAQIKSDPTCFAFIEKFPGGFTPRFGGELVDYAGAIGTKGNVGKLNYDVSFSAGRNDVTFHINNTINASLGPDSPTEFTPGQQIQTEKNFNIDLSYAVPVKGFASDLNIAGGFEWRNEEFELISGDAASYTVGPYVNQGFSIGSNGFNGFRPSDAGVWDRTNTAFYIDLEADVTEKLVLGAAVRTEDFDTFGQTTNYKLSGLLRATDVLTLRSTYSTGFRAPTPGQANVVNTTTSLIGGVLANTGTVSPTSVLGQLLGGKELKPEESKNFSLGGALDLGGLKLTVDYFNIKMEDRIRLRSGVPLTPAQIAALTPAQLAAVNAIGGLTSDFTNFKYFVNGVDSTTQGVDFVASYPLDLFGGKTSLNLVANWTETDITRGERLAGIEADGSAGLLQLEQGLPKYRGNVSINHYQGKWSVSARLNYYGEYYDPHADDPTLPIYADAQVTFDTEVGYDLTDKLKVSVGADNLFDSYPTSNPYATILGAKYSVSAPAGFNGGFYYLKLSYKH
jgi:iron complex outermembrane recepter protein